MKIKKVEQVYQCDFCGKWYLLKWRAINHENKCRKNPNNKIKCFECSEFENIDEKWICKVDDQILSRNPKYNNQKQVCTLLNNCKDKK